MNAATATEPVMWRGSGEWVRVTHSPLPETTIQPNRVGTAEGRSVLRRMWSEGALGSDVFRWVEVPLALGWRAPYPKARVIPGWPRRTASGRAGCPP